MHTDSLIFEALKKTGVVYAAASEETPKMVVLNPHGEFIVTFDPLDGSSVIDANFSVGSIFAIWKRKEGLGDVEHMLGFTGKDIIGACLASFGSRTVAVVYNTIHNRVDEIGLHRRPAKDVHDKDYWAWIDQRKNIVIKPSTKTFSPGNIKASALNEGYGKCLDYWIKNGYTLRYSGCMASDCFHIFVKGEGIFSSVSAPPKVPSRLRVLYENLPIAFLIVKAGGWASDGVNKLMRITVTEYAQKSDIIIGSKEEVGRAQEFITGVKY